MIIDNIPAKWVKYQFLVEWGLRDARELDSSIKRFKFNDYLKLLNSINNELENNPEHVAFIVKLIAKNTMFKLPNYSVSNESDLEALETEILKLSKERYYEIWYCRYDLTKQDSVFGRLCFDFEIPYKHDIELVWDYTARGIEYYPYCKGDFISITRKDWTAENYIVNALKSADIMKSKEDTETILKALAYSRKCILEFCSFLNSCGTKSLSIEFKFKDDKLYFIDWDSDDDERIINKWMKMK